MAECLVWKALQKADCEELARLKTEAEVQECLRGVCSRSSTPLLVSEREPQAALLNGILLDFYSNTIKFGRTQHWDSEPAKLSALFSIAHSTHTQSMANRCTDLESFDIFERLLLQHSVARPPFSEAVFNVEDVKAINTYFTETYYCNYKMYFYTFTPRETARLTTVYGTDTVQLARTPKPLSLALTEEDWLAREAQKTEEERLAWEEEQEQQRKMKAVRAESEEQEEDTGPEGPVPPPGLTAQLESIKAMVSRMTADKLADLESKITMLEEKVVEPELKGGKDTKGGKDAKGGKKK